MTATEKPDLLREYDAFQARLRGRRPAVFLDYDGTLTPIVARPEDAVMSEQMRECVRRLARCCPVAIVSGRDRKVVEEFVQLKELQYAGSHGFDISGPLATMQHERARKALPDLDDAEGALERLLKEIPGAQLERKKFAIAAHYRNAAPEDAPRAEAAVDEVLQAHPSLRKRGGKKVFELQPDVDWDKGKAVLWLLGAMGLDEADVLPIYVGDDLTDEDAFKALKGRGIGVRVGPVTDETSADFLLKDTEEVRRFLEVLAERLPNASA
jgi:trehalose-phosphatase